MIYLSLLVSALLLIVANTAVARKKEPGLTIFSYSLAFMVAPLLVACFMPAVTFQAALLTVTTIVWRSTRGSLAQFLALSCGATLVAYGLAGALILREHARLRSRFPYESIEARLPAVQPSLGGAALPAAAAQRLSQVEEQVSDHAYGYRTEQLESLHERAVTLFINSPGFGESRMPRLSVSSLVGRGEAPAPGQPGSRFASMWSPGELEPLSPGDDASLSYLLEFSIVDFVNARGFGYFKDRRHVAGFQTHRFSRVPVPVMRWKVQALDLVSLLIHDEPEVYVSSHLPQMAKVHDTPTRPLDRFEKYALPALRQGEDIVTTQTPEGARMLGAIRSTRQCIACHGGERGALLGAFSYNLRLEGP